MDQNLDMEQNLLHLGPIIIHNYKKLKKQKKPNIALNLLIRKLQIMESIPFWTFLSSTNWISCNKVSSFSRDGFNKTSFTIPKFYGPKSTN